MSDGSKTVCEWTDQSRFAIYYAPARGSAWWDIGCSWLGRDPESGQRLVPPVLPALGARSRDVPGLARAPQRYGWHGTWVAPARCVAGAALEDVFRVARGWARRQEPFDLHVEAAALERFVAIRPATADGAAAMRALAADALHEFAPLRAMPNENERRRRLNGQLTERQRELLDRWGYPFVLDEFRFHMTLSDPIDANERQMLVDWWNAQIPQLGPLRIDGAAVFAECGPTQPFLLVARFPFEGAR
jgi:hypothetical protein